MKASRFEEVLEECLSAHLEGRRSIEESLLRYPALRGELEPLLRTAVGISDRLQSFSPPVSARDRGLQRFLSDARARQRVRQLTGRGSEKGWLSGFFGRYALGLAATAAALALAAVVVSAAIIGGGGSGDGSAVQLPGGSSARPAPETPVLLTNLQNRIETIRQQQSSGTVDQSLIEDLRAAAEQLRTASPAELEAARAAGALNALAEAESLVLVIAGTQPDVAGPAQETVIVIRDVAGVIGGASPESPAATPEPQQTPATGGTEPTPVDTIEPEDTPAPTPEPTDPPTPPPAEAPQATPEIRGLPGIAP